MLKCYATRAYQVDKNGRTIRMIALTDGHCNEVVEDELLRAKIADKQVEVLNARVSDGKLLIKYDGVMESRIFYTSLSEDILNNPKGSYVLQLILNKLHDINSRDNLSESLIRFKNELINLLQLYMDYFGDVPIRISVPG